MNNLFYQFLLLMLCVGAGVYLNRRNFGGLQHKVGNYIVPQYVISAVLSFIIGVILWIILLLIGANLHLSI